MSFLNDPKTAGAQFADSFPGPARTTTTRLRHHRMINAMPPEASRAAGLHVLIIEDEALIALDLQDMLRRAGAARVDIARNAAEATLYLSGESRPHLAIVNVEGESHDAPSPTQLLTQRAIPFFFATGASDSEIMRRLPEIIVVSKPYTPDAILSALTTTLMRARTT